MNSPVNPSLSRLHSGSKRLRLATGLLGLILLQTASVDAQPGGEALPSVADAAVLDGVWRSEGYGEWLEVSGQRARFYQVTGVSCLPGEEFRINPMASPNEADRFPFAVEAVLNVDIDEGSVNLLRGNHANEKWLQQENSVTMRQLQRTDSLPQNCASRGASTNPVVSLNVFTQTFAEHYPFFAARRIDWAGLGQREQRNITAGSGSEELFAAFRRMLEPLGDSHTYVRASNLGLNYRGNRRDASPLNSMQQERALSVIDQGYLVATPRQLCNGQLALGQAANGIRYLRLLSLQNLAGDYGQGLACLEAALDETFTGLGSSQGLILDLRINGGGYDPYGLAVARRLTGTGYLAYVKEVRVDPSSSSRFGPGEPVFVKPVAGLRHPGPVVVLTGPQSEGAAEVFLLALMGREPAITRIGQTTQGVLSDTLIRELPNGWRFQLPNARYLDKNGFSHEATGIPPDFEVPVFSAGDLQAGQDPALEQALSILSSR